MWVSGAGAAAGWVLDQLLGEPPTPVHPVAGFGALMGRVEARTYRDERVAGVIHLTAGVGLAVAGGAVLNRLTAPVVATAVATYVSVAGRMLGREATLVLDSVERGELDAARAQLPTLVARDVTDLREPEIVRAVIESVAENTVDAVVAPLCWAPVAGAPGALVHRAVKTLDAWSAIATPATGASAGPRLAPTT